MNLIFSQAKSIRNKAKKARNQFDDDNMRDIVYNNTLKNEIHEFREILKIAQELHDIYNEVVNTTKVNWYFITIRPQEGIEFKEFKGIVEKYLNRKCFLEYTFSYEQKGTNFDELGKGFHCHIVANTTWRSKIEGLRQTISTFKGIASDNCIQIDTTREPSKIIKNYLIDYESKDGHKIVTKEWDTLWRSKEGLGNPTCLSSPCRQVEIS